jgi:DNA-binding NarL/FixJ family response regulator
VTIRLVLADDHPIVLGGLKLIFSDEPDFAVVGQAKNGDEALQAVREFQPDILVLDLRMPGMDGLGVLREMKGNELGTRVVVLTAVHSDEILEAIRLGACGIVLKDTAAQVLVQCIRDVYAGKKWLDQGVATRAVQDLLKREEGIYAVTKRLTSRELQVARMVADGLHTKAVARKLSITEGTAKLHLHHIYEKLDLDGRVALARYMQSHGLA